MSEKKYELIPSDKEGLFIIKALKSFSNVTIGDIGGYVSGEHNLSHDGDCWIYNNAEVYNYAQVYDDARISDSAQVYDHARVYNDAKVSDFARVYGSSQVSGFARIYGNARIYSGSIQDTTDYMLIGPIGSRNGYTTFFKDEDKIMVSCGCFEGTIQEFEDKVKETHQNNNVFKKQYLNAIIYVKSIME